jgi:hypothetical protein
MYLKYFFQLPAREEKTKIITVFNIVTIEAEITVRLDLYNSYSSKWNSITFVEITPSINANFLVSF